MTTTMSGVGHASVEFDLAEERGKPGRYRAVKLRRLVRPLSRETA
jgi:hypothetical protein